MKKLKTLVQKEQCIKLGPKERWQLKRLAPLKTKKVLYLQGKRMSSGNPRSSVTSKAQGCKSVDFSFKKRVPGISA